MSDFEKLLALRPDHVKDKLGSASKLCLLSSRDIMGVLRQDSVIIMACNARMKHILPGLIRAAAELDAIIAFELAKSESDLSGGYTGMTPKEHFEAIVEYAEKLDFRQPFFIHADHTTVKDASSEAVESARELNKAQLEAGYTSFSIDASFNELEDNIRITVDLAKEFEGYNVGLEAEVGEIKLVKEGGSLTTVKEASDFIAGIMDAGLKPNFLAINNGSKHGNYSPGEEPHIDLERTGEIWEAIRDKGIDIAQHGITGTPLNMVGRFADHGIRKGNDATQWQNIAHKHLPPDLSKTINDWCEKEGKNIKMATKPFKKDIEAIPEENSKAIEDEVYREAKNYIEAFRAVGTASKVAERLGN